MKIIFVSKNREKIREIKYILSLFDFEIDCELMEIPEVRAESIEEVSRDKAKYAYSILKRPLIVDDTGIFFNAYKNFPGIMSKFLFNSIGVEGILKLIDKKDRSAFYKSSITYISDSEEYKTFSGILRGSLSKSASKKFNKYFPYDSLFVPVNYSRPRIEYSWKDRIIDSHRYKALRKFVRFMRNKGK